MKFKNEILSFYMVAITSVFYTIFLYVNNIKEILITDFISMLILMVILGCSVWGIMFLILKDQKQAAICSCSFMLLFTNFSMLESVLINLFSSIKYWHVLAILLVLWISFVLFIKSKGKAFVEDVSVIVSIAFTGLLLLNVVLNLNDISKKLVSISKSEDTFILAEESNNLSIPNVYYLVFDEYASNSFMEKYYEYDNSEFTNWLTNNNFKVSYSSRSDYFETRRVMANNVNLDYIISNENADDADNVRKNGLLFRIFQDNGYEVRVVGLNDFYGMPDPISGAGSMQDGGVTSDGFGFKELILKNTPLYVYIVSQNLNKQVEELNNCLSYMEDHANFASNGVFTLMHIELPHTPFVFDKDGNSVSASHLNDWEDPQYYLEQYIYTTKRIKQLVEHIIEDDPDSIIILTSDHSVRNMPGIETEDKKQCFLAYYNNHWDSDIEGQSTINILRITINQLFDLNMEMLSYPDQ